MQHNKDLENIKVCEETLTPSKISKGMRYSNYSTYSRTSCYQPTQKHKREEHAANKAFECWSAGQDEGGRGEGRGGGYRSGGEAQKLYGALLDLRETHSRQTHELLTQNVRRLREVQVTDMGLGHVFYICIIIIYYSYHCYLHMHYILFLYCYLHMYYILFLSLLFTYLSHVILIFDIYICIAHVVHIFTRWRRRVWATC